MKNVVIVARGRAAFCDVFRQNQLFAFQFANLALIRADDDRAFCFHDAVKKLADLPFLGDRFQLEGHATFFCLLGTAVPQIAEYGGGKLDEFTRGRQRADKGFQRLFDLRPRNGLSVAGAAVLAAHVIGIATARPLGPGGGHRTVAIAAGDEAAHRKIRVDVLARWSAGLSRQTILNEIESLKGNQPLMLRLAQRQVPARHGQIPGIQHLRQDLIDALVGHDPLPILRE